MKVLCNVLKDSYNGGQTYNTPIASAAQVDSGDICNSGETLPHHHMDWRFIKHNPERQVIGWVNRLEVWQEYADTVAKNGRECDPLHILGGGPTVSLANGTLEYGQVMIPNYLNNAIGFGGKYEYVEIDRQRTDDEVANAVQFKTPFAYMTTYLGYTKGKKCGPLPNSMADLEAYKGCAICPHKQGLVVKGVCQAHGQIFNRDIFPLTTYFNVPNRFVTIYEDRVTLDQRNNPQGNTLTPWTIGMDEFLAKGVTFKVDVDGSDLPSMMVTFDNTGKQIFYYHMGGRMYVRVGDKVTYSQPACSLNSNDSGRIVRSIHDIAETA